MSQSNDKKLLTRIGHVKSLLRLIEYDVTSERSLPDIRTLESARLQIELLCDLVNEAQGRKSD